MPMSCLGVHCAQLHCPESSSWSLLAGTAWAGLGEQGVSPAPALIWAYHSLLAQEELMNNTELVQSYRQQIGSVVNQFNLQLFLNMYNR